jgi:hypothetical protein
MASETVNIAGGCHCGEIRYQLEWPVQAQPIPARACGCSYCTRFSATWTSHPDASIDVTFDTANSASRYKFGTSTADFIHCANCGVLCLAISHIDGHDYAVVNINTLTFPAGIPLDGSESDFSGEETPDRLARRKQRWIGVVNSHIHG